MSYQAERATAALDHNVFLDLHIDISQGRKRRRADTSWKTGSPRYVELCLTDEIFHEIHNHPDAQERSLEQYGQTSTERSRSRVMTGKP